MGNWTISWGALSAIPLSPWLYVAIAIMLAGATYAFMRERGGIMMIALAAAFGTFALQERLTAQSSALPVANSLTIQTPTGSTILNCEPSPPPTPTPTPAPTVTPTATPTTTPTVGPTPIGFTAPAAGLPQADTSARKRAAATSLQVISVFNNTSSPVNLNTLQADFSPVPVIDDQCVEGQNLPAGATCYLPCAPIT